MNQNIYLEALELVKQNYGTSSRAALAKFILSLYNHAHPFSIGEVLDPLDGENTEVVLEMLNEFARNGETAELRQAGEYVYKNFPNLIELSNAMQDARTVVRQEWVRQQDEDMRRLYPD